ncbi:SDR family NAD(P)-dependent oxidoreductase [Dongshaea marina]|uniref:SDR family NAD(P)-dependent oxidoreductase n=1 Tax=Dongshaea marina TaxID=2047966 RepID=UPI000D3E50E3|nr:SDR family oxidoreductase [Dongshaea marina]
MRLVGKKAFITGATSGIGLAIAIRFAEEGADVAINGRDRDKLTRINREYFNGKALEVVADLSSVQDIRDAFQQIRQQFGRLDTLVVNAGVYQLKSACDITEKEFDSMFELNVKGAFFTMQQSLPLLNESASVITISSVAAQLASWNQTAYNASKAALSSLTKSFACGLAHKKIRVNSISPGLTDTPIWEKVDYRAQAEQAAERSPLGRQCTPQEVTASAVFLASDESAFMTTSDLLMDGGRAHIQDPAGWGSRNCPKKSYSPS